MSIADEIRVNQNYGPEGYKFEVLAGELKREPMGLYGDDLLVHFYDVPLTAFANRIPAVSGTTDGSSFYCRIIDPGPVIEHYDVEKDAYSYRCEYFTVAISGAESGKTISFAFDGKMIRVGGGDSKTWVYQWPLIGKSFNLDCRDLQT